MYRSVKILGLTIDMQVNVVVQSLLLYNMKFTVYSSWEVVVFVTSMVRSVLGLTPSSGSDFLVRIKVIYEWTKRWTSFLWLHMWGLHGFPLRSWVNLTYFSVHFKLLLLKFLNYPYYKRGRTRENRKSLLVIVG